MTDEAGNIAEHNHRAQSKTDVFGKFTRFGKMVQALFDFPEVAAH